jgi:hypothetical protein
MNDLLLNQAIFYLDYQPKSRGDSNILGGSEKYNLFDGFLQIWQVLKPVAKCRQFVPQDFLLSYWILLLRLAIFLNLKEPITWNIEFFLNYLHMKAEEATSIPEVKG